MSQPANTAIPPVALPIMAIIGATRKATINCNDGLRSHLKNNLKTVSYATFFAG